MADDDRRNGVLIAGIVFLTASVLLPLVVWSVNSGSWEGIAGAIVFTVIFGPLLFFVGLILLIVGLRRGSKQQQQQQVVFMSGQEARSHGFVREASCPDCGGALGGAEAFCIHCGRRLQHG